MRKKICNRVTGAVTMKHEHSLKVLYASFPIIKKPNPDTIAETIIEALKLTSKMLYHTNY